MSSKRPPAPPPALAGFTYVDVLGSGGFADVYLYEQHLPRRRVAVKVMLADRMAGDAVEQFTAEANVMAMLSTHPAIVTIYQAGVSDDGRPYLVMEYCPKPNLQIRSRASAFSIAEALRVGVQVGAAVETAHRAGILHRDIKPANILVTEYNRPALTDFGIATTAEAEESSAGMSIPWSPPESFSDQPGSGVVTDVYALGATVFTLLAGRSPFEQPGGRNGGADLIQRIESQPVPRLERADAPVSLQLALERAMAKRPGDRYESAVAFARALQRVQIELAHSVTPIDILDDAPAEEDDGDTDGELTRVRGIVSIEPQTNPAAGPTRRRDRVGVDATTGPTGTAGTAGTTGTGGQAAPADSDDRTLLRGPVSIAPGAPGATAAHGTTAPAPGFSAPSDLDDASTTVLRGTGTRGEAAGQPATPLAGEQEVLDTTTGGAGTLGSSRVTEQERVDTVAPKSEASAPPSRRGLWITLASVGAAVIVVGGIAAAATLLGGGSTEPEASPSASVRPQDPIAGVVPPVTDLAGSVQGGAAVFTWTNPEPEDGDGYLWYPYTLSGDGQAARVAEPTVSVPVDPSGTTCIAVMILRADGTTGPEKRECTP
ncbi:serine/threonine-protein kinase [Microbacterium paulum]